jgi:hypothetical protein
MTKKLLEQVSDLLRVKHYLYRAEQSYFLNVDRVLLDLEMLRSKKSKLYLMQNRITINCSM